MDKEVKELSRLVKSSTKDEMKNMQDHINERLKYVEFEDRLQSVEEKFQSQVIFIMSFLTLWLAKREDS